ncbi:MAG: hypothetical protein ACK2U5_23075 [Candidatus Promineifilaceae bacterium]
MDYILSRTGCIGAEVEMSNQVYSATSRGFKLPSFSIERQRKIFIGIILLLALLAFEIFNFDTTQFALQSLLGDVKFLGIMWATILAIAFCSIDFAGLIRLFSPENGTGANKEAWYLMGAWLLGATMNAIMTWWAVSLTLLNNNFGNEVLSRDELLHYVPIFVAVLVWLTRILFIGAFSIAGAQLFQSASSQPSRRKQQPSAAAAPANQNKRSAPARLKAAPKAASSAGREDPSQANAPDPFPQEILDSEPSKNTASTTYGQRSSRVRQRPPVPNSGLRKPGSSLRARRRSQ